MGVIKRLIKFFIVFFISWTILDLITIVIFELVKLSEHVGEEVFSIIVGITGLIEIIFSVILGIRAYKYNTLSLKQILKINQIIPPVTINKKENKLKKDEIPTYNCIYEKLEQYNNEDNENNLIKDINNCLESMDESRKLVIIQNVLKNYINKSLEDGLLDEKEEKVITTIAEHFKIDIEKLEKLQKAKILYEVLNGKEPSINISGNLPILLGKKEKIIFVFSNVSLIEEKKQIKYKGNSGGFSFRIAKGVYYSTRSYKGERVEIKKNEIVGIGLLVITNKNLYFISQNKSLKIPLNKIISVMPSDNALIITQNNKKPIIFVVNDIWFAYNLLMNAQNVE